MRKQPFQSTILFLGLLAVSQAVMSNPSDTGVFAADAADAGQEIRSRKEHEAHNSAQKAAEAKAKAEAAKDKGGSKK